MKKVNYIVRGLLVAVLALSSTVFPSLVLAADNESVALPGVDARAIVTDGTTNYVSDFNSTDVLTVDIPAISGSDSLNGDGAYGMSFAGGNLFVATGKYDLASTSGGLQVFDSADLSTPLSVYGTDTYTYSKVFTVGDTAFVAFLDDSWFLNLNLFRMLIPPIRQILARLRLTRRLLPATSLLFLFPEIMLSLEFKMMVLAQMADM